VLSSAYPNNISQQCSTWHIKGLTDDLGCCRVHHLALLLLRLEGARVPGFGKEEDPQSITTPVRSQQSSRQWRTAPILLQPHFDCDLVVLL
jgi:hypothetical protein